MSRNCKDLITRLALAPYRDTGLTVLMKIGTGGQFRPSRNGENIMTLENTGNRPDFTLPVFVPQTPGNSWKLVNLSPIAKQKKNGNGRTAENRDMSMAGLAKGDWAWNSDRLVPAAAEFDADGNPTGLVKFNMDADETGEFSAQFRPATKASPVSEFRIRAFGQSSAAEGLKFAEPFYPGVECDREILEAQSKIQKAQSDLEKMKQALEEKMAALQAMNEDMTEKLGL